MACLCLVACGSSADGRSPGESVGRTATWAAGKHIGGVVDLSVARRDGATVVAAAGRLALLSAAGDLRPFAAGYSERAGLEPYIALASGQRVRNAGCVFAGDGLYVLRLSHGAGVTVVDRRGQAALFARLPPRGLENGIAFDRTGRFDHRLLVTAVAAGRTTVFGIDCRGRVTTLSRAGPRVEGGLAVAPATFGRFAGDLIAPDELSGRIYAIEPDGRFVLVASSGLAHGQDLGVESAGFVPPRFGPALVADRLTPGNRHPGDDLILRIGPAALAAAGVRGGDLLVVTEGGAQTVGVRCQARCRISRVAGGPAAAHIEGHVVFGRQ